MKKMILALMAVVLMSTSYAQKNMKLPLNSIVSTEISGDVVLLYNSNVNPLGVYGDVKLYIDGNLFGEEVVCFNRYGIASVDFKELGQLPTENRNFEVIVTVLGSARSTTGVLQCVVCHDYEDNYTFGTAIGTLIIR